MIRNNNQDHTKRSHGKRLEKRDLENLDCKTNTQKCYANIYDSDKCPNTCHYAKQQKAKELEAREKSRGLISPSYQSL